MIDSKITPRPNHLVVSSNLCPTIITKQITSQLVSLLLSQYADNKTLFVVCCIQGGSRLSEES